jgi:hypothetical protein
MMEVLFDNEDDFSSSEVPMFAQALLKEGMILVVN